MLQIRLRSRQPPPTEPLRARPRAERSNLATQVGPRRVRLHPTYVEVGDQVARGLVLHEWPRLLPPGAWAEIFDGELSVTVSQDIVPRDRDARAAAKARAAQLGR